mmetsp:Transcript_9202/g.23313  ORF Transcript_9202/g.23313 Transcript_9202/m.23313 type:complete len:768 (+) Transcript_9202:174-2477(+)
MICSCLQQSISKRTMKLQEDVDEGLYGVNHNVDDTDGDVQLSPSSAATATASATMAANEEQEEVAATVCCGCRPTKTRKYQEDTRPTDDDDEDSSFSRPSSFFRRITRRRHRHETNKTRSLSTEFFTTSNVNATTTTSDDNNNSRHHNLLHFPRRVSKSFPQLLKRKYFDADMGQDVEWYGGGDGSSSQVSSSDESMYFFDALEDPLDDEEYPIDSYVVKSDALGEYPIHFTTSLQHPAPHVSMDKPETMLKKKKKKTEDNNTSKKTTKKKKGGSTSTAPTNRSRSMNGTMGMSSESLWVAKTDGGQQKKKSSPPPVVERWNSEPINNHKEPSVRFLDIQRRPTLEHKKQLEEPRVKSSLKGYPGELEIDELEECQKFLRGLRELDPSVAEQVFSFRDIEEQPYTICRWLRATKFDADKILQRLQENQELFDEAKADDFYPNIQEAIGAPLSVFLSQYPFIPVGRGKNGSPVNFFLAGKINPEGILAITTIERLQSYFWYSFMWKFKDEIRAAQDEDPDFVRCEGINILDLNGLSSSAMTSETMEVIKVASKISDFFPETLHCMLVINAPSFFALSWGIIKKFIDPRTAARINLFANRDKGLQALKKLVDTSELPTDYCGENISLQDAFLREASDPALLRQNIELICCKKRKSKSECISWTLEDGECMEVGLYTRSVSKARISVSFNDETMKEIEAECLFEGDAEGNTSTQKGLPRYISIGLSTTLVGPGTVTIQAEDLDTATKSHSGMSRGYFLIVGDVKLASIEE